MLSSKWCTLIDDIVLNFEGITVNIHHHPVLAKFSRYLPISCYRYREVMPVSHVMIIPNIYYIVVRVAKF